MDDEFRYSHASEWEMSKDMDKQIAELIASLYPVDFGGRSFMHQRHHFRLLAHQNSELVGHVAVLMRTIRMGGSLIDVLGLAEVATAKHVRRRGIATRLVNMAIETAHESTAQFVILFGTEKLYQKSGFIPKTNPISAVLLPGNRSGDAYSCGPQPLMVCPTGNIQWDDKAPVDLVGHIF